MEDEASVLPETILKMKEGKKKKKKKAEKETCLKNHQLLQLFC